ncbi:MAG TPA: hypothetical protein VD886_06250, partial [Herpetosiphonaceae bacterium]|nr:hypothetical protein [Herpetosiphonaceae bacterium]
RLAEALEAERAELADLPANIGNGPDEAIYQQLSSDAALLGTYLSHATAALDSGQAAVAVAFLRRAAEIDPRSAAQRLLPLARLRLNDEQKNEAQDQHLASA